MRGRDWDEATPLEALRMSFTDMFACVCRIHGP